MIPKQLQKEGINFVLLERGGKKPFQKEWQKKEISFNSEELLEHIKNKGNYGVRGGGIKNLIIIDFDDEEIQKKIIDSLPRTFTVKTGRGLLHKYFFSDYSHSFKIFSEDMDTYVDVQGEGKQVVGPNSVHPNGNYYEIVDDSDIGFIHYAEVKALLMQYDKKPRKEKEEEKPKEFIEEFDDFIDILKTHVSIKDVLEWIGINTSKNPTECPFHSSKGGKCLGFKFEIAHCFHCDDSWNIISLVKQYKNCNAKRAIEILSEIGGLQNKLEESRKRYIEKLKANQINEKLILRNEYLELISGKEKNWSQATELLRDYICNKLKIYTTKDDLKSEMWVYQDGVYLPQGRSEIKILLRDLLGPFYSQFVFNKVIEKIEPDTFIDADLFFKQTNIEEIPLENGILNIFSLELKPFSPDRIFFNKLPVKYNPTAICSKIESFLKDVLSNKEDIKVFYELAGFSLLNEYKFEKAFMFVGSGRNGKGKAIELLKRLVGMNNCCSIPLTSLVSESFSISELFGKRLNLAGDIGNRDLKDTSMFKSLTGRDLVSGKRKFMRDINFENYAKFVFACNELPMVYDMTRGFWDRWILMEFPFTFVSEEEYEMAEDKRNLKIRDQDIIKKISTEEEMSGLLNEALIGLHRLISNKKFSATKGTEEVKRTWIRKSNSFIAFCYDMIEENPEGCVSKKILRKEYANYCKEHGIPAKSDYVIKNVLQSDYGVVEDRKNLLGDSWEWVLIGINIKKSSEKIVKSVIRYTE